ncbi:NAD(P)H-dependent oxidoreductase [Lacinutrix sp. Bg11-31]|uniref:NAD(P)H-dependent oxidoreductase n=1 Tax=Lacinutrix sp. Bg11-31 TaxID=2057808 RepID=UPI000C30AE91|nr:NAD(P)H-dependent oxidoreductase [Lacinutrix sp. Bg11-31]AUC81192.1 NAD(P)H-dependent oxidoreductase [Lacinutrix sp. Bg11-31]
MNVIEALKWRYATKSFDKDKMVSKEKLDIILKAFNLTATSYGLQPLKLLVIENKKLQKDLVSCSMNQEQVAQASQVLVICIETLIDKAFIENYFSLVKSIRNTPDAILNPFKDFLIDDFESKSESEIIEWSIKQAYIALGNLLTVCALEGIDACPMEGFDPTEYDKILNLKFKGLQSVLVLPIGYRAADDFMAELKKVRKDFNDSVIVM